MREVAFPEWNNWVAEFLGNFPVYIQHDRTRFTPIHRQPGVEIHIVCEGRATLFLESRAVPQQPRQVSIFGGATPHQLISDDALPFSRVVVCADLEHLSAWRPFGKAHPFDAYSAWTRSSTHFRLTAAEFTEVWRVCGALIGELSQKKRDWPLMTVAHLLELTTLFARSAALKGAHLNVAVPDAKLSDLTLAGARYAQEHLGDELTLQRVAELLAVSPEHLTRTFRRDFRVSFYRYVLLLRIEEAKRLLWGPVEVPITEVAAAVGFRSLPHFSRTFQRLTGQTPSSFRRHKTWP